MQKLLSVTIHAQTLTKTHSCCPVTHPKRPCLLKSVHFFSPLPSLAFCLLSSAQKCLTVFDPFASPPLLSNETTHQPSVFFFLALGESSQVHKNKRLYRNMKTSPKTHTRLHNITGKSRRCKTQKKCHIKYHYFPSK